LKEDEGRGGGQGKRDRNRGEFARLKGGPAADLRNRNHTTPELPAAQTRWSTEKEAEGGREKDRDWYSQGIGLQYSEWV